MSYVKDEERSAPQGAAARFEPGSMEAVGSANPPKPGIVEGGRDGHRKYDRHQGKKKAKNKYLQKQRRARARVADAGKKKGRRRKMQHGKGYPSNDMGDGPGHECCAMGTDCQIAGHSHRTRFPLTAQARRAREQRNRKEGKSKNKRPPKLHQCKTPQACKCAFEEDDHWHKEGESEKTAESIALMREDAELFKAGKNPYRPPKKPVSAAVAAAHDMGFDDDELEESEDEEPPALVPITSKAARTSAAKPVLGTDEKAKRAQAAPVAPLPGGKPACAAEEQKDAPEAPSVGGGVEAESAAEEEKEAPPETTSEAQKEVEEAIPTSAPLAPVGQYSFSKGLLRRPQVALGLRSRWTAPVTYKCTVGGSTPLLTLVTICAEPESETPLDPLAGHPSPVLGDKAEALDVMEKAERVIYFSGTQSESGRTFGQSISHWLGRTFGHSRIEHLDNIGGSAEADATQHALTNAEEVFDYKLFGSTFFTTSRPERHSRSDLQDRWTHARQTQIFTSLLKALEEDERLAERRAIDNAGKSFEAFLTVAHQTARKHKDYCHWRKEIDVVLDTIIYFVNQRTIEDARVLSAASNKPKLDFQSSAPSPTFRRGESCSASGPPRPQRPSSRASNGMAGSMCYGALSSF